MGGGRAVQKIRRRPASKTAQKCTALLGHETKPTTLISNYCLASTAAAFLLLGIFFGLIFGNVILHIMGGDRAPVKLRDRDAPFL